MSELRKDPFTNRWVIVARDRHARPQEYRWTAVRQVEQRCPFCVGNEADTPEPVLVIHDAALGDGCPWHVRIVPNRYPALIPGNAQAGRAQGLFCHEPASGVHEVIVESPNHVASFSQLPPGHAELALKSYVQRLQSLAQESGLAYAAVFKNVGGRAGASLEHAHSQLVAMPYVPSAIREKLNVAKNWFETRQSCLYCQVIGEEISKRVRIVAESPAFVALCPYASRFPFETWIFPKRHDSQFQNVQSGEFGELAGLLTSAIRRLETVIAGIAYNFILHTSPFDTNAGDYYHWHVEIIPRMTALAGFELGTECFINTVPPEDAAAELREGE